MMPGNLNREYQLLLAPLDDLTRRSKEAFGEQIQCRKGCGLCCHGLFDIGVLDALLLHAAWRDSSLELRADIENRSESLLRSIAEIAPLWIYPFNLKYAPEDEVDRVLESLGSVACPVLSTEQGCRLYEARPFYCRVHGLKIRDTAGTNDIETDCELNFTQASPERKDWPGHAFTTQFRQEGDLIAMRNLDPDSRFLIPAVTTQRFAPFAEALGEKK